LLNIADFKCHFCHRSEAQGVYDGMKEHNLEVPIPVYFGHILLKQGHKVTQKSFNK